MLGWPRSGRKSWLAWRPSGASTLSGCRRSRQAPFDAPLALPEVAVPCCTGWLAAVLAPLSICCPFVVHQPHKKLAAMQNAAGAAHPVKPWCRIALLSLVLPLLPCLCRRRSWLPCRSVKRSGWRRFGHGRRRRSERCIARGVLSACCWAAGCEQGGRGRCMRRRCMPEPPQAPSCPSMRGSGHGWGWGWHP